MTKTPRWYLPVTVLALLWNLIGCAAYLSDVMLTAEDIAQMSAAQQALYSARSAWAVSATAIAVWAGAAGCVGLIWRKRWAMPLLLASLAGLVVQDVALFTLSDAGARPDATAAVLQAVVLGIGIALVYLARTASVRGWIS
ncbi:MAG: hypothetical protein ABL986_18485 [Vicinamibacterales bacterium]